MSYKRFKFTNGALENKSKPQNALQKMQTRFRITPAKPKNKKSGSACLSNAFTHSSALSPGSVPTHSPYEFPHSFATATGQTYQTQQGQPTTPTATITITPASDDGTIKRVQLKGTAGQHTFDVQVQPPNGNVQGAPLHLLNLQFPTQPTNGYHPNGSITHHQHHPNPQGPAFTSQSHSYELNFELPPPLHNRAQKPAPTTTTPPTTHIPNNGSTHWVNSGLPPHMMALDDDAIKKNTAEELFGDSLALTNPLPEHDSFGMGFNELLTLPDFCLDELEKFIGGSPQQTTPDEFLVLN
jgi:hypothetical protein